jgi:hypothetical protein
MIYNKKKQGKQFVSPHFQVWEFASSYSDTVIIEETLIDLLEKLYLHLGCSKMTINSGYRTPNHSVAVGGYANDDHTKGIAADIKCYDSKKLIIPARAVCIALEDLGVKAIGYINQNSTHVSSRQSPKWFGDESTGGSFSSFYTHFGIPKEQPISVPIVRNIAQGSKVVLMPYATRYATGQLIPLRYRNKTFTVAQMGNGKALLKELMSWVLLRDIK